MTAKELAAQNNSKEANKEQVSRFCFPSNSSLPSPVPLSLAVASREEIDSESLAYAGLRLEPRGRRVRLTLCSGNWVREGIGIVFFAPIDTREILLNQERERSEIS